MALSYRVHGGVSAGPRVSVVMPVHNSAPYVDESIRSILDQTFADFEFVTLDDASDDETPCVLRGWAARDGRIRVVRSDERLGPVGSSNRVVAEARAPVCARMDADDVSHGLIGEWMGAA